MSAPATEFTGVTQERIACPFTITVHRTARAQPQPNFWPSQLQIVAQDIQQRSRRVHVHRVCATAIDFQIDCAHVPSLPVL